ncbi:AAA family ATPase [Nitriliruptor alkaliphilus]|uniref:AAA family ATPase n=1 Tax=Nitriliruptor alkaliphilus TaxID=427918 RepID=UPI000697ECA1|nr:AAA family ATPase [Nitriliruptor alkaliphilus]
MADQVLLAIPEGAAHVTGQATAIIDESETLEFTGQRTNARDLFSALDQATVDVVVLHEDFEGSADLQLAADLNRRYPDVSVVLLATDHTPELLRAAMFAGVRALVPLPLQLEELVGALTSAAEWAATVRDRMRDAGDGRSRNAGSLLVLAGSKGGVGTTTLSVLLSQHLAATEPSRSVCLVDLDLQTGDVRAMLDLNHRRSITDLVAVADELTTRHFDEALIRHASGVQVLLPPVDGELGEDVDTTAARRILAALRARFDLVIVDLGTTMTEASAAAVEMADRAIIVAQPEVPSLRGANRLLALWQRLAIRDGEVHVVVNRTSRDHEIQPDLVDRVLKAPTLRTSVPARFRDLEAAVNTGDPGRIEGVIPAAIGKLGDELDLFNQRPRENERDEDEPDLADRVTRGQAGQVLVDFVAFLPILAVVLLVAWQLVLFGWAQIIVNNSSREAARQLAVSAQSDGNGDGVYDDVYAVARDRVPGPWRGSLVVRQSSDRVQVRVDVPVLRPGFGRIGSVRSTSGTVIE